MYSFGVAKGTGHEVWQVILGLVKNLSEVILTTVPNFWKIAKNYTEGKYKKVNPCPQSVVLDI
jgi:exocyst complex component 2